MKHELIRFIRLIKACQLIAENHYMGQWLTLDLMSPCVFKKKVTNQGLLNRPNARFKPQS